MKHTCKHLGAHVAMVLAVLLSGCARVNDTGLGLVSTARSAYLLVNGQLLSGEVVLVPDRTGRVSFSAEQGGVRSCSGGMRYTATHSGDLDVRCSDGTQLALQFTTLSETRGYGYGTTAQGVASMTFGLSNADALAFLKVPEGKKLVMGSTGDLALE